MKHHMLADVHGEAIELEIERFTAAVPHHFPLCGKRAGGGGIKGQAIEVGEISCITLCDGSGLHKLAGGAIEASEGVVRSGGRAYDIPTG